MTKESIHKEIIKKFGSMSKFARLSGLDRYELQKVFARKVNDEETLCKIEGKIRRTANKSDKNEITVRQIDSLRKALKTAGGVIEFSKANPQFPEKSVYQILSGRRKRMTKKVQELFSYFKL